MDHLGAYERAYIDPSGPSNTAHRTPFSFQFPENQWERNEEEEEEEVAAAVAGGAAIEEGAKDEGGGCKETKKEGGGGPINVVLKVDMHCDGCCDEVRKTLRGVLGVEKVTADIESNKLTVIGKVDPIKIRDLVQSKSRKKVELISPQPKKNKDGKKEDAPESKEPSLVTVELKIRLHCEGCTKKIRKKIMGIKGVASLSMDPAKDQVTVKGIMDVKSLVGTLKEKMKRPVEIIPPKKEKGCDGKGRDNGGNKKKKEEEAKGYCEGKKVEYCYGGDYICPELYMEMVHAPQLFSDENPNACFIM
ncbi:uncharacterized protein A4U43_C07F18410 [Asparagus officinalis]|uniref:HMA domain-containing protein n=1 Tax=Asparagus officinalis TaxID=4686 RepID=A0A5P1EFY5_ASPOF|nr:uncharacterized protein A4U43_C07F18410 [Asparagus officinalis]